MSFGHRGNAGLSCLRHWTEIGPQVGDQRLEISVDSLAMPSTVPQSSWLSPCTNEAFADVRGARLAVQATHTLPQFAHRGLLNLYPRYSCEHLPLSPQWACEREEGVCHSCFKPRQHEVELTAWALALRQLTAVETVVGCL